MTHEDAFFQAILERPRDDAPRLIFADWLDDHGDCDRAEFIRLQCQGGHPERVEQLLRKHDEEWAGPVVCSLANAWVFERGFVHAVTTDAAALVGRCGELFAAAPVRRLRLLRAGDHHLAELITAWELMYLVSLDLDGARVGDRGLTLLSLCRFLRSLAELHLRSNDIGPEGVAALTSSPLCNLRWLDLSWNRLGRPGAELLANWPALDRLDRLDLSRNDPACYAGYAGLAARLGHRLTC